LTLEPTSLIRSKRSVYWITALLNYPFTPDQIALLTCARTAWDRRRVAKARGLSFGEEAITETILMDLAVGFPGRLDIVQFTKNQEGKRGADRAWAFRNATGTQILPMLVQAKLLDPKDHAYPEIARLVGKKRPPVRQIDRLIATASSYGWPALYAFYNHLDNRNRIPDHCITVAKAGLTMPECWGVSVALAQHVRDALDPRSDQRFDTHSQHSIPLHCLLCSGGRGERPTEGGPGQVMNSLNRLIRLRGLREGAVEPQRYNLRLRRSLPLLFERALAAERADAEQPEGRRVEALARSYPRLAGVVVLQDSDGGIATSERHLL
jgi:hypothetical protein